jgi:hypothetical protein
MLLCFGKWIGTTPRRSVGFPPKADTKRCKNTLSYSTRIMPPSGDGSWRRLQARQLPVTLIVTLPSCPTVTLDPQPAQAARPIEGDKVEEVEEPPNPSSQGDSHPQGRIRIGGLRLTRARARTRVTSGSKSLYPDYGNRPQPEFLRR